MVYYLVVVFLFSIIYLTIKFLNDTFSYWSKKGVFHLKPVPLLGNFREYILLKECIGIVLAKICEKFPDVPYVGAYFGVQPILIVQDPELIKIINTKDISHFSGREISEYTYNEVITQNVFFTYGDRWKVTRQNLTPMFTSAKMKNMFQLIKKCTSEMEKMLDYETCGKIRTLEVRSLMARYTMDSIGSCAFGIDVNTMVNEKEQNPFITIGDLFFKVTNIRAAKFITRSMLPSVFYGLGFTIFPKELDKFFNTLLKNVFKNRHYKPSSRNDFVDMMLGFKEKKNITGSSFEYAEDGTEQTIAIEVTDDLLVSNCVGFFAAGFETSSTTLGFTLYELAKHEDIQKRVLEEIDIYFNKRGGIIDYDCITGLPFLESCIDEALRLYPILPHVSREVTKDYKLPSGLVLQKGLHVYLPIYYMHRKVDYFSEPESYRPERFYGDEKKNINENIYMPFGVGSRKCIGMRFAKMQMLAGLATFLKNYRVILADDMPRTVKLEAVGLATGPIGGIKLKLVPRSNFC